MATIEMSDYPLDLAESDYYDEILGPPPEPDEINDLPPNGRWVGRDKAVIEFSFESTNRRDAQFSDINDYDPRVDEDLEDNDATP